MISVTDNHGPRLLRVAPSIVRPAMGEEIEFAAKTIAEDATFSIRDGATSGPGHIASAPGQPPNADSHDLDLSIRPLDLIETPGEVRSGVIADSDHALYMERGTSEVEARPFLEPAAERQRPDFLRALAGRYRELLTR